MTSHRTVARPDGVVLVSVWFFIQAALALVGFVAIVVFAFPAVIRDTAGGDRYFAVAGLAVAAFVLILLTVLPFVTAIGLLELHGWARWAALVLAGLGLIWFPIGTAVGVLIIWYLLSEEARQAFSVPGERTPSSAGPRPAAGGEEEPAEA